MKCRALRTLTLVLLFGSVQAAAQEAPSSSAKRPMTCVPIGQSQELYSGLKKNGVPVQLVFYPREPHGLQEPRHQLDKMKRENEWIRRWIFRDQTAMVP